MVLKNAVEQDQEQRARQVHYAHDNIEASNSLKPKKEIFDYALNKAGASLKEHHDRR